AAVLCGGYAGRGLLPVSSTHRAIGQMNVLDLFSGIGGFSLGLERAGMRTVAFCEIDPYCQAILRKHWPAVPVWGDIRELTGAQVLADATRDDVARRGYS